MIQKQKISIKKFYLETYIFLSTSHHNIFNLKINKLKIFKKLKKKKDLVKEVHPTDIWKKKSEKDKGETDNALEVLTAL